MKVFPMKKYIVLIRYIIIFSILLLISMVGNVAAFSENATEEKETSSVLNAVEEERASSVQNAVEEERASSVRNAVEEEKNFTLYAKSAVLMDADSGRVLYEKDGYAHMPNASTTKIMTCILAIESGSMEDVVTVSAYAASMPKVRLGMQEGDEFKMEDLLYSLMLESHNDSAVAIAEHVAGSVEAFAELMNEKAEALECTDTFFITPNGLDAQTENGIHGTTARDLAVIMSYCLKNETFLKITQTANYSFTNIEGNRTYSCYNHNAFLTMMEGAITGKTGFTGNAGYCYVGALKQDDRTFVVALLACGWPNNKSYKWADTKALMQYGLKNYQYEEVFEHDKVLGEIPVEQARPEEWVLYQKTYITPKVKDENLQVLKKANEEITVKYELPKKLEAPLHIGEQIGQVNYFLEEQCIASYPVCVEETVEKMTEDWYGKYIMREFLMWK